MHGGLNHGNSSLIAHNVLLMVTLYITQLARNSKSFFHGDGELLLGVDGVLASE